MRNTNLRSMPAAQSVRYASRQIWLAGLGAAAMTRDWAETEAGSMFRSLVKEGTLVESRTIRKVGDRLETSFTMANSAWRRARTVVQSSVRDAAGSAVALVQNTLPRALPHVKLPAMLTPAAARKATKKRAAKVASGSAKSTRAGTAKRATKRTTRTKARSGK